MRIINLQVKNVKKIEAVDITPKGNAVVISGKNGNGKSSLMDSIAMALGGKRLIPSKPVREGQKTASIDVDLGEFIVSRRWHRPEQSYLTVTSKDGAEYKNPQTILNKIIGDLSFDPSAFVNMEPSKRLGLLKKITKLDFDGLDSEYKENFEKRTVVKRDFLQLQNRLDTEFNEIEAIEVSGTIEDANGELEQAIQSNGRIVGAQKLINNYRDDYKDQKDELSALRANVDLLTRRLENGIRELHRKHDEDQRDLSSEIAKGQGQLQEIEEKANGNKELAEQAQLDLKPIYEKIQNIQKAEIIKDQLALKEKVKGTHRTVHKEVLALDSRLKEIKEIKDKMISGAEMPIKGLEFGDGEVLFNGIPFQQLSTSEQMRVSMAIAIALNPRVRVITIENGSLLDSDAMKQIIKIAEEKDLQIWLERVSDSPDGSSIFIEEGKVLGGQEDGDKEKDEEKTQKKKKKASPKNSKRPNGRRPSQGEEGKGRSSQIRETNQVQA